MTKRIITYVGAALLVGGLVYVGINDFATLSAFVQTQANKVGSFVKTLTPSPSVTQA